MISQMYAVKVKTGTQQSFILQDVCNVRGGRLSSAHATSLHQCKCVFFIGIRPRVKNKEWIHKTEIWQWHLTKTANNLWKKLYTINTKKIKLATLTDVCLCRISDKSDAKFEKSKHTCRQTDPGPGALSSDKLFVSSNYENDAQAATSQLHLRHRTEFLKKETIPHNWPWNLVL